MGTEEIADSATLPSAENDDYKVTISYKTADVSNIPDNATVSVKSYSDDSDEYATAKAAVIAAKKAADEKFEEDSLGLKALDISILDKDGNEIEPDGKVSVKIELKKIPDGVDEGTELEISHIKGTNKANQSANAKKAPAWNDEDGETSNSKSSSSNSGVEAETVASDVKAEDGVSAEFSVSSFSTFTLTWGSNSSSTSSTAYIRWYQSSTWVSEITVHYVDQDGNEIPRPSNLALNYGNTTWYTNSNTDTKNLSDFALDIDGYSNPTVHLESRTGDTVDSVNFVRSGSRNNYTYTTSINNGNTTVATGTAEYTSSIFGSSYDPYTNNIYIVYTKGTASNGATIIYEDENGNELTISNTLASQNDTTSNYKYLIYDIDNYEYDHTYIVHSDSTNQTNIDPYLYRTGSNTAWKYYGQSSNSSSLTTDATQVRTGDVIHVVYKAKTSGVQGGTPTSTGESTQRRPSNPTVDKISTDNNDGTRTLALSIKGAETTSTEKAKADVIVILDTSGSMAYNLNSDSGNSNGRLNAAKSALDTLANTLLTDDNDGAVRMSLITFSDTANSTHAFTDSNSIFKGYYSNASADGGTNWEDALATADRMAVRSDAATYVIFVTDGDPTFRNSRGNYTDSQLRTNDIFLQYGTDYAEENNWGTNTPTNYRGDHIYGKGSSDVNNANYNAALAEARSIISHNKTFYTIGMGPSVSKLSNFTSALGLATSGDGSHYFLATNETALQTAFSSIASTIKTRLGFADVRVTDGIPSLTNLSAKTGSNSTSGFTYTMTDANGNSLDVPDSIKTAKYDSSSGSVVWNFPSNYQLEDGVTYKVEFTVWPSQEALDHVAKLNNGQETYSDLSNEIKAQIKQGSNGTYTLATNDKDQNVKVKESMSVGDSTSTTGDDITLNFYDVDPLKLQDAHVTITKDWGDDTSHTSDPLTKDGVNLTISDGQASGVSKTLTLNTNNRWSGTANISAGLIVENGTVLESGHDFTLSEATTAGTSENISDYWQFSANTYRPMIINGTVTMLQKGAVSGATQYTIDDETYSVVSNGSFSITATNTPKFSSITIVKTDGGNSKLSGAKFKLVKVVNGVGQVISGSNISNNGEFTTDNNGEFTVSRILPGTYKLTETEAPAGYIIKEAVTEFTVNDDGSITVTSNNTNATVDSSNTKSLSIANEAGKALPNTGGSGTTMYTLGGLTLIIASALMYGFILKNRKHETD